MTFGDLKRLDYPDSLPLEMVLEDMLLNHHIDYVELSKAYTDALEREKHIEKSKFNEASANLCALLSGNFKGEDLLKLYKRLVHTYNLTDTFPKHIYDSKYNYAPEDEKHWDDFTKQTYGVDLNFKPKL